MNLSGIPEQNHNLVVVVKFVFTETNKNSQSNFNELFQRKATAFLCFLYIVYG
jgi:hypothetical protein